MEEGEQERRSSLENFRKTRKHFYVAVNTTKEMQFKYFADAIKNFSGDYSYLSIFDDFMKVLEIVSSFTNEEENFFLL